jgi:CheY-like chemotaxis protein
MNQPTAGPLASHRLDAISVASGDHMQTILVVEDEPLVRLHVCSTLEEEGYTVLEAGCADAAIRHLTENDAVGVMLTDVRLPGRLDGLQLASRRDASAKAVRGWSLAQRLSQRRGAGCVT